MSTQTEQEENCISSRTKDLAEKLGVPETAVAGIAINQLYQAVFPERHTEDFDFPTEEQLSQAEKLGLIQRAQPGEKSAQLASLLKDA